MKTVPILILLAAVLAPPSLASAQSLADVAQREASRRQAIAAPGRVYTNASLPAVPPPPAVAEPVIAPPPETGTDAPAPPPDVAGFDDRDEPYWRTRAQGIRRQLLQHRRDVADLLARALTPAGGAAAAPSERAVVLAALADAQADLGALEAELTELEKEAATAKVPAAWVR